MKDTFYSKLNAGYISHTLVSKTNVFARSAIKDIGFALFLVVWFPSIIAVFTFFVLVNFVCFLANIVADFFRFIFTIWALAKIAYERAVSVLR